MKPARRRPSWLGSFRFATDGLVSALRTERNLRFHFAAAAAAMLLSLLLHLDREAMMWLLLAVTMVIAAELLNTAVEYAVDVATQDHHPFAKIAKDVSAAAVLVTAAFAAVSGALIFYEPLEGFLGERIVPEPMGMAETSVACTAFVLLIAYAAAAVCDGRLQRWRPSIQATAAASGICQFAWFVGLDGVSVLLSCVALMTAFVLLIAARLAAWRPALCGICLGTGMTCLALGCTRLLY